MGRERERLEAGVVPTCVTHLSAEERGEEREEAGLGLRGRAGREGRLAAQAGERGKGEGCWAEKEKGGLREV